MPLSDRRFICIHPDDQLNADEFILKKGIERTVGELLRLTFREDEKHLSMAGDDPRESRVTNWNFAGLWRAYAASGADETDELATVYPGVFDFTEYFSRSVDASKGDFYEMRIAASDPNEVLDVDRYLENLPQYLYAPHLAWKEHEYTPGELGSDERRRYDELDALDIDFTVAPSGANVDTEANTRQADSILLLDHSHLDNNVNNLLVFGEQRSSVNTGGTTARGSLYDKPKALLRGLANDVEVVHLEPDLTYTDIGIQADRLTLFEFLLENEIQNVHFYIGMLFNTVRQPAERTDDRANGRWSESENQTENMRNLCTRLDNVTIREFDADRLDLIVDIDDPTGRTDRTLTFRLAHEYGNHYANAIYNGYPDRDFDRIPGLPAQGRFDLPKVMGETEADDLWLNFSITERENKAFYYGTDDEGAGQNNAMRMVDQILGDDDLREQLSDFRDAAQSGDRETLTEAFTDSQAVFAEAYLENYRDAIVEVYGGENPRQYAYDLAAHVLCYDVIVAPIFLKTLPDYHHYDSEEEMPRLAFVRKSMEEYLYEPTSNYSGTDRVAMFKAIRGRTRYERGGATPAGPDDEIDWSSAPTAGTIADDLDVDTVRPHYMDEDRRGLVKSNKVSGRNRYAVPADIASELDEFLFEGEAGDSTYQATL